MEINQRQSTLIDKIKCTQVKQSNTKKLLCVSQLQK